MNDCFQLQLLDLYSNFFILELHTQIISFLNCLQFVPEPVIKEILQRYRSDAELSRNNVRKELQEKIQPLQLQKVQKDYNLDFGITSFITLPAQP